MSDFLAFYNQIVNEKFPEETALATIQALTLNLTTLPTADDMQTPGGYTRKLIGKIAACLDEVPTKRLADAILLFQLYNRWSLYEKGWADNPPTLRQMLIDGEDRLLTLEEAMADAPDAQETPDDSNKPAKERPKTCGECRWFAPEHPAHGHAGHGNCLRHPPHPCQETVRDDCGEMVIRTFWYNPPTHETRAACGDSEIG